MSSSSAIVDVPPTREEAARVLRWAAARGWSLARAGERFEDDCVPLDIDEVFAALPRFTLGAATREVFELLVEREVAAAMWRTGGISGGLIAERAFLTNEEVGRALARMRGKGYVKPLPMRFYRRPKTLWFLTREGETEFIAKPVERGTVPDPG